MSVDVVISNIYSLIGALLLTGSQSAFSIQTFDRAYGYLLAVLGSIFMLIAFYRLHSMVFFVFNAFWLCVSFYGLFRLLDQPSKTEATQRLHSKNRHNAVHFALFFLALAAIGANLLDSQHWASICAVSIFIIGYTACSNGVISQRMYIGASIIANLSSLQYLLAIQNYVSSIQILLVVVIALYGLLISNRKHLEQQTKAN